MKNYIKDLLMDHQVSNSLGVKATRTQELILMRGVPGSGKSTAAKNLVKGGVIHSTDNLIELEGDYKGFFEKMKKDNNFSALSKMHSLNFQNAKRSMQEGVSPIVIDNTNLRPSEMKKYVIAALELGFADDNIKIVNVGLGGATLEVLAARNIHGVPMEKIKDMVQTYNTIKNVTLKSIIESKDMRQATEIMYSAIVLDDISRTMLLREFADEIPDGWTKYAHHMTIAMGKGAKEEDLGKEFELEVGALGKSDTNRAVMVHGYESSNSIPHVTLAVHPDGKPAMSNDIRHWIEKDKLKIRGIVTNIKRD